MAAQAEGATSAAKVSDCVFLTRVSNTANGESTRRRALGERLPARRFGWRRRRKRWCRRRRLELHVLQGALAADLLLVD